MIKESMINITKNNDFKSQLDSLINTTKFKEETLKNLNNLIKNEQVELIFYSAIQILCPNFIFLYIFIKINI